MFKKYLPYIILFIILIIAAYLRLYRIGDYMGFLGDEGRDMLVVKRMIVDHKLTLLGPITSVGLMHLGPMYYYFMVPFLWAWRLDPTGPAVMVALFSLATILLIWKLSREFFDTKVAVIASLLYALSPLVITYSHSSWNPNILPFWALLTVYSLVKVMCEDRYRFLFVAGLAIGVALQLHYIALVFIPITLVCLGLKRFRIPLVYWLSLLFGGFVSSLPFLLFEVRHQFINTITVYEFVTRGGDAKSFGLTTVLYRFWDLTLRLFWRVVVIENARIATVVLLLTLGICFYLSKSNKYKPRRHGALIVLLIWYLVGIGLLSFYTGNIYDYYLMFAFPLPFLLVAIALSHLMKNKYGWLIAILVVGMLSYFELKQTPILAAPNRLVTQTKEIAQFILDKTSGKPYNFALIAYKNSDHAYRYFLEIMGTPPVVIENPKVDPNRKSVTDQLLVVCEEKVCQPLGHPLWEIAGFGRAEITDEWQVGLFKVFRLVHYLGENQPTVTDPLP
ncbi:MAG: hypothetical protein UV61_C0002G0117 [Candidatus Gottesmanbacteria bacterium GW2011_GWB1_43_11]|uniref:Glycosyltransferase RgtA/B/C/D-like domain-containing protein n=1 Tax=Candidatus Gottesmanbacteria bacterium GW2011_GWB1_43_11 TaxID=1618446 RepID=A0A0G1EWJ6_9BACT|nr:MAG: hypothetical protein UV04_C0001G0005 [Candidatus Gottesmanbacteria bacterium GW2011_GWA2_42_16]KKS56193.1 MAG: hypothetical protein UV17_C0001G0003 [Candidatus Gottesmanbacteria bacterium GW2011_GWA1_42_26]KKS81799.1 MAG: dolichyl-phosphate-mannose-protein mannosyltransferase [Candidatus Gottesmanbacteria bacterium GW2011_GWC1_43_10]KKS87396.1 MAG: hypothetical protein UV61_C0002G0117 [Candidatus Gottesmanbacteria bacterium GW2011_GWB1_43_11]OGG10229.1 MAG: hypothetical protein A2699_01